MKRVLVRITNGSAGMKANQPRSELHYLSRVPVAGESVVGVANGERFKLCVFNVSSVAHHAKDREAVDDETEATCTGTFTEME